MSESTGDRIYMIRRLLGPDSRTELPLAEFEERVFQVSGRRIDKSALSKMERGKQRISIKDAEAIAQLDPKQRGPWWIAWGVEVTGEVRGDESPSEAPPVEHPDSPIPPGHTKDNPYRVPRPSPTRKQGNG